VSGDILLTGASGVLGSAIARRLSRAGYALCLTSRNPSRLKALSAELKAQGGNISVLKLNLEKVSDIEAGVKRFFKTAKQPSGLVSCAGDMGELGLLADANLKRWLQTIHDNFLAQAVLIRSFILAYQKHKLSRGTIIVMGGAGVGGDGPFSHMSAYGSSKAALSHLVEAIAAEVQPLGLTLNAIAPGQVVSSITEQVLKMGDKVGHLAAMAKRGMETGGTSPDLTAQMVESLLKPEARAVTGRLLSARFDLDALRQNPEKLIEQPWLNRLRRIDNALYSRVDYFSRPPDGRRTG
jgi:NAD(P)-dependent dehydrogenase (short-subunit alcohol dehydrogenase family)